MIAVTKLIDLLDKPSLVRWANNIGLKGISLDDYYKESQSKGKEDHKNIENYLKYGKLFVGFEKLEKSLSGYEILGVEKQVGNDFISGRADLIIRDSLGDIVVDVKSSPYVYLKTKLQLCCYASIIGVSRVGVINTETLELKILSINIEKYFDIVRRLFMVNKLLTELNEKL